MEVQRSDGNRAMQHQKMMGFDARLLVIANLLGLVLAVPILVTGSLLAAKRGFYCITFMEKPIISLGILLVVVSVAGILAAWLGKQWLYWVHVVALLMLAMLLFSFAIFSVDITSGGSGHPLQGTNYSEYVLADYPKWMRRRVEKKSEWKEVTLCLQTNGFCNRLLPYNGTDRSLYDQTPLSPIQSGCCKPPTSCNFAYIDATHWITPSTPDASVDCGTWDNDPSLLCYQCSSCKAGVIQATKDRWRKAGVTLFVVLIILITFYAILGFAAFRRERKPRV